MVAVGVIFSGFEVRLGWSFVCGGEGGRRLSWVFGGGGLWAFLIVAKC